MTGSARNTRALSPLCVGAGLDTPSLVGERLNARATRHAKLRVRGFELASEAGFVRRIRGNVRARERQSDRKEERGRLAHGRTSNVRPDATHRHRSRCRRCSARARASDCYQVGTKANCLSGWALTCPRERLHRTFDRDPS